VSVVDRVYARALFDAALDEDRLEQVRAEIAELAQAVAEIPELRELLRNPQLDPRARATRRASLGISSASDFAWPISLRCSSTRFRASVRALSASSSAFWMRVRRSSIVDWMRPNAYRLST